MNVRFRHWLTEKYMQHKDECEWWQTIPEKTLQEYFNKYKWWLRTLYRKENC